jgi:hypothetical protein
MFHPVNGDVSTIKSLENKDLRPRKTLKTFKTLKTL